ncbi:hypothetical protein EVAR_83891_1 [Eumeta japonica]|uniref:Reverse transcriptase domain-containing protein n=1 Tax=Eumeta variegata TaxID=151549 RepID=A0A4C1URA5_EUMVA|nr:hypothetical protein EVAR_83891_1 [Eumeta japonica]
MDDILKALKHMEDGKAAGYDKSFVRDAEGQWRYSGKPAIPALINPGKAVGYLMSGVNQSLYPTIKRKVHSRGVRQGCVSPPWLFNLFMDSRLYDLKEYECGLRMDELFVKCPLYSDDQVTCAVGMQAAGDGK